MSPSTASVVVGANLTLTTESRDADGKLVNGVRVSWSSEDASVATVSQSGVVTGVRVGSVLIAASARGKDAFARVTVSPAPVVNIRLSHTNRSMVPGEVVQLTADPLDASGTVLADREVTWSTSNATVATVTSNGLVTAVSTGGAIITATSEGRSAVASITVAPVPVATIELTPAVNNVVVGQTTELTLALRDAAGTLLTGRLVVWSTSDAQVATVTSQGIVTAVSPGSATVSASIDGISASIVVNVTARPPSAVIVSPEQVTIFAAQSLPLSALVTDDRGQVIPGRPIVFSSSNPQVASVSSAGVVTGISPGTVTITATSEGASGTATVTVSPEQVAVVEVSPAAPNIAIGQAIQLSPIARAVGGQSLSLTGRTVSWSTSAPAVASVSSSGMVSGVSAGTAVIIATVDGKQGSALVTVAPATVASVVVSPVAPNVNVGQTVQLTATPRDAGGQPLTGRVAIWTSSASSIATVSSSGLVTGVSPGSATITATVDGRSGSATVTVSGVAQGQVTSVTVTPSSATVNVAWSMTLSATARDGTGSPVSGAQITWASSNAAIATVSSSGVVTGVGPGTATIIASSGGASGTASITVQLAPVDRIVVTPSNPAVDPGKTVQLTATLYDAHNNVLAGRTVQWSSADASKATVNASGLVTAIKKGNVTITASSGGKSGSTTVRVQ